MDDGEAGQCNPCPTSGQREIKDHGCAGRREHRMHCTRHILVCREMLNHVLFSISGPLFRTLPTSLFARVIVMPSDSYGRSKSIGGRDSLIVIQPAVKITRVKDYWHAIVYLIGQFVSLCGQNRERIKWRMSTSLSRSPL